MTLLICVITILPALTQEDRKTRVAFYDNIYTITNELDQKIQIFGNEYTGFKSAELFRLNNENYTLEIEQAKNNEISIETKRLSESEGNQLKKRIAEKIRTYNLKKRHDHSGRYLKVQSLTLQGSLAGLGLGTLFGKVTDNDALPAATPLIGFGTGILGGIISTANKDVSLAPTLGYASGAFTGGLHGLLVGTLFDDDPDASTLLLSSTAFSIGESILLQHIIRKKGFSAKRASAIRLGNISGAITGGGLSFIIDGDGPNVYLTSILTLAGSAGGILLYDSYFKNKDIGVGNLQAIRVMNPVFSLGASAVVSDLTNATSGTVAGITAMAASVGGVFLGESLFKNGNVTYDESLWYGLGLYGGMLIGSGISTIIVAEGSDSPAAIISGLTTLFGLGGLYAVHTIVAFDYDSSNEVGFFRKNKIHVEANPLSIYLNRKIENPHLKQSAISLSWTF